MKKMGREGNKRKRKTREIRRKRKRIYARSFTHAHTRHSIFSASLWTQIHRHTHTHDNREEEKCVHSTVWRSFACFSYCFFFSFLLLKSLQLRWKESVGKEEKCPQKSRNTKLILFFQVNYHPHTYRSIHDAREVQWVLLLSACVCFFFCFLFVFVVWYKFNIPNWR